MAVRVFIRYCPECIGCAFERFCTMQDVALHYNLPLSELAYAIETALIQQKKGETYET